MNTHYTRIIPRDLFNESKLLKCIGRLTLLIFEGKGMGITYQEYEGADGNSFAFEIGLEDDGHLAIKNIKFKLKHKRMHFKTIYNNPRNYPLLCEYDYCEYEVFNEQGEYTPEFIEFCKNFK